MKRSLVLLVVFPAVACLADPEPMVQFRYSIPEHNVTGTQPPPWPEKVETALMRRIEREAPRIAGECYESSILKQMRFRCLPSQDKRTAFDIVIEGPEDLRGAIKNGLIYLDLRLLIRYVELAFIYDTTWADIGRDDVAPLGASFASSRPNQSSEPTLSSVTPPAGQESRPR